MNDTNTIKLKDGRTLGYAEYGDRKGKPIFYFHGWPTSRLQAVVNDTIAKKLHIRIISIDRPGYGLSDYKEKRTLLDWPDDVTQLADTLHINKFAVMGVSGGGPYAAVCAYKIPKRLTRVGIVVGLAPTYEPGLLDGMPFIVKLGWSNYGAHPWVRTFSALLHYVNAKYGPSMGLHRFMFMAKQDRQAFSSKESRKITRDGYREAFKTGYQGVEQDLQLYSEHWGFKVKDIRTKVYLFYGEDDKNVSINMGKYYATNIVGSTLITYPNEGHMSGRTHAREILKILTS